jgi:predicted nucleic acid-binding protein
VRVRQRALERAVPPGALLALDASATLAYLGGNEAASPAATWVFDAAIATGRNPAILSSVTVAEILVRPFRAGAESVGVVEGFLRFFGLRIVDTTYEIAREAARIRAATGLSMPDAIVIGSAVNQGAELVVANDRAWPRSLARAGIGIRVLQLEAFVTPADAARSRI